MDDSDLLPLSDAVNIYCKHLGLPDHFAKMVKAFALSNVEDVVWLSDEPLTVYRGSSGLLVNSKDLFELLKKINPIVLPDAP